MKGKRVDGGHYYELRPDGRLVDSSPREPNVIVCRRVADFPQGRVPVGAAVQTCTLCTAPIAYNPARSYTAPLVCMQCADVRPLPL